LLAYVYATKPLRIDNQTDLEKFSVPQYAFNTLFAFDELDALEEHDELRYELWEGQPVAMTGGTRVHNLIALGLYRTLYRQLQSGCEAYVADMGLRLDASTHSDKAYPDVMLVCGPQIGAYQTQPVLVAEVLSESSVSRDRNKKFAAYKTLDSLCTYLILSQTAVEIEVYRRTTGWTEEIYRGGESIIRLDHPELALPLREIYNDVWTDLTSTD
jgi:Uma2 family endonuclease